MELKKVVNKSKKYKAKNGKEYCSSHYYLVLDNGTSVCITCPFPRDFVKLDTVAKLIVND